MDSRRHSMDFETKVSTRTKRRSSILKQTKVESPTRRMSLQEMDVNVAIDDYTEVITMDTEQQVEQRRISKRVSFANTCQVQEFCRDPRIWIDKENNKDVAIIGNTSNDSKDKQKETTSAPETNSDVEKGQQSKSSSRPSACPDLGLLLTGPIQYVPLPIDASKDSSCCNGNISIVRKGTEKPNESLKEKHGSHCCKGGVTALEILSNRNNPDVGERTYYECDMIMDQTNRSFYVVPSPSDDECSDMQLGTTTYIHQEEEKPRSENETFYFGDCGETMDLIQTVNIPTRYEITSPITPPPSQRTFKDVLKMMFTEKKNEIPIVSKEEEKDEEPIGSCSNQKKQEAIITVPVEQMATVDQCDKEDFTIIVEAAPLSERAMDLTDFTLDFGPSILPVCSTFKPQEQQFDAGIETVASLFKAHCVPPQLKEPNEESVAKIEDLTEMENKIVLKDDINDDKSPIVNEEEPKIVESALAVDLAERHNEAENRSVLNVTVPQTEVITTSVCVAGMSSTDRSSSSKKRSFYNTVGEEQGVERKDSLEVSYKAGVRKETLAEDQVPAKKRQGEKSVLCRSSSSRSQFLSSRLFSSNVTHIENTTLINNNSITNIENILETLNCELPEVTNESVFDEEIMVEVVRYDPVAIPSCSTDEAVQEDALPISLPSKQVLKDLEFLQPDTASRSLIVTENLQTPAAKSHISIHSVENNISKNYGNIDDVDFPNDVTTDTIKTATNTTFVSFDHRTITDEQQEQTEDKEIDVVSVPNHSLESKGTDNKALDTLDVLTTTTADRQTKHMISSEISAPKNVEAVSEANEDEIVSQEMPPLLDLAEDLARDFESAFRDLSRLVADIPTEEECLELEQLNAAIAEKQQTLNKLEDVLREEKKERREIMQKKERLKAEVEMATKAKAAEENRLKSAMWLTRCAEFCISEWSDTKIHLSFLNTSLHISFSLAPPIVAGDITQPIIGISKWSKLKDDCDPLIRYAYDSLWKSIDEEELSRRCRTTDDLKNVLFDISYVSANVRMLSSNLQSITVYHNVFVKDETISIEFIEIDLLLNFMLKFSIVPGTYPDEPISFAFESLYGELPLETLTAATKVDTGPCYLRRVVKKLEEALTQLTNKKA